MRVFHVGPDQFAEIDGLPQALPDAGFLWIGLSRHAFELQHHEVQAALHRWSTGQLVDLHISDLANHQLPSQFDYTSWYDLLVFRRLAPGPNAEHLLVDAHAGAGPAAAGETPEAIDTRPVGFAAFDRVLISVHPPDCAVREYFAERLQSLAVSAETRGSARLPTSPADLMLRMVNHLVDGYLDLRRLLSRQLGALQQELLDPRRPFSDWSALLQSRNALQLLEDTCEDQRGAVQEWIDALDEWPVESDPHARRERELLRVRSRDVLEHVERVLSHVRRLAQSVENAVQMHFSALSHRTNEIMRTLTVLTAIFLPLNLITGYFGMNFESLPFIHVAAGAWWVTGLILVLAVVLGLVFHRKRYFGSSSVRGRGRP